MKLFTASRAVGLAGLIVVLAGTRVCAQDVTVTDPAWFDPEKPGAETLPTFKKKPAPEYPRALRSDQSGYVLVWRVVDESGGTRAYRTWESNPYFGDGSKNDVLKFKPATKAGKAVNARVWYAIIFNPASAQVHSADAAPRLLAVAPVYVSKTQLTDVPGVTDDQVLVWAKVKLDESGAVQGLAFENAAHEVFRGAIKTTLAKAWRFAPAKAGGQAVAAEAGVAFAVMRAPDLNVHESSSDVMPKVLKAKKPEYPYSLRRSGHSGEVLVEFIVDAEGKVREAAVLSSNHPAFEQPALDAIHEWKFKPGMKDGKPVNVKMRIPIVFNIEGGGTQGLMKITPNSAREVEKIPDALRYDVPPKPKGVLYPNYPYDLLIAQTGGKALVRLLVGENGRVVEVEVLKADQPEFGEALSAAVAAFEFMPALKDGRPSPAVLTMDHTFDAAGWNGRPSPEDMVLVSLVKKSPEKIVGMKALDAPLKPISRRSPVFPATAKSREGSATIEVLVDTDGRARLPRIVSASEPALGYAAAQAAGEWRFEEPKAGGKAVVVRARLPFTFAPAKPKEPDAAKAGE